jgi:riboflavin biosynthesis pyrimidine reductase
MKAPPIPKYGEIHCFSFWGLSKGKRMRLVQTLVDSEKENAESALPPELREMYDGDLRFRASSAGRPYVIANFVSTLDGVVSYAIKGKSSGSAISDSNLADRFIMGLLRASVDAVMVGAGTLLDAGANALWTPEYVYPDAKGLYADYRVKALHKPEYPLLVIVSGSGQLALERAIFHTPAMRTLVVTTPAGSDELTRRGAAKLSSVEVRALNSNSGSIDPLAILELLQAQFGVSTLLHEGGPTLFGQFLAAEAVDELFLTLSPQIAGRKGDSARPAIVQGVEFVPDSAPRLQMLSAKANAAFLYLRYRRTHGVPSSS